MINIPNLLLCLFGKGEKMEDVWNWRVTLLTLEKVFAKVEYAAACLKLPFQPASSSSSFSELISSVFSSSLLASNSAFLSPLRRCFCHGARAVSVFSIQRNFALTILIMYLRPKMNLLCFETKTDVYWCQFHSWTLPNNMPELPTWLPEPESSYLSSYRSICSSSQTPINPSDVI